MRHAAPPHVNGFGEQSMALRDSRWAYRPVCPLGFYNLLAGALALESGDTCDVKTASEVVAVEMPHESDAHFRDKYLLREVLRKYPAFDLGVDTREAAKASFYEDEAVNLQTNDRLVDERPPGVVAQVLQLARKKISTILGRFDEEEFWHGWRFGPHSTVTLRRHEATLTRKLLLRQPAVSLSALPFYLELRSRNPFWAYESERTDPQSVCGTDWHYSICQFDRWTSVRKNAKTDRGIGVPPDANVLLQLSVGRMLRKRLFEAGINLNDQSINQLGALRASETGETATVDVKSASQSVTCGLVWSLIGSQPSRELDMRWYATLDALRTPYTLIDGDLHENELFSAMGNGYTFELESLIFYGLAWACTSFLAADTSAVTVYGDDIILPVASYGLLTDVFQYCGFRINQDKSFHSSGPFRFRESCGKHFLNGVDVTPFYVDSPLTTPASIILLANNLHRWASHDGVRDGRVYPVWLWVLSHLSEAYLSQGIPFGEANDGVILSWDECVPRAVFLEKEGKLYPTHVGWKAKTVEMIPRPLQYNDYERYLRWQYHHSLHSGFKPPAVPLLGSRRFRCLPFIRKGEDGPIWDPGEREMYVEPSLKTAAEVPLAKELQVDLRVGSRVVTSWPSLGPWVGVNVVDPSNFRLHVAQARWRLSLEPGIASERDPKDQRRKRAKRR